MIYWDRDKKIARLALNFFSVQNIFDSSSKTFSGTKFFRYRFRDFFPVPNFSDTGSDTFLRYQIFPIPVPRLFSGTNFFRYRFRYHQKNEKFPIPGIPGTGTSNSAVHKISVSTFCTQKVVDSSCYWAKVLHKVWRAPHPCLKSLNHSGKMQFINHSGKMQFKDNETGIFIQWKIFQNEYSRFAGTPA